METWVTFEKIRGSVVGGSRGDHVSEENTLRLLLLSLRGPNHSILKQISLL